MAIQESAARRAPGGNENTCQTVENNKDIIAQGTIEGAAELRQSLADRFPQHAYAVPGAGGSKYVKKDGPPPKPIPESPIVLYPIEPGSNTTRVGVLDFDDHNGDLQWTDMVGAAMPVVEHLRKLGHFPLPFRSGGGRGIHVWLVWDEPQSAAAVIELLDDALAACGFDRGDAGVVQRQVEVFPKQDRVPAGKVGNGIALPLSGKSSPLHPQGLEELTKPRFIFSSQQLCLPKPDKQAEAGTRASRFDEELIKSALESIPADDYSVWIDVLRALKGGAKRAGVADEKAQAIAMQWSAKSAKHDEREFKKKWEESFCREARGEGRSLGTLFYRAKANGWAPPEKPCVVERVRIQESDPPLFLITISGSNKEVVLKAADVTSPMKFQNRVLETTYKLIERPKTKDLRRMLDEAERVEVDESATTFGQFKEHLGEYIAQLADTEREKLRIGFVWFDEARGRYWFRWVYFEAHLKRTRCSAFIGKHAEAISMVRTLGGNSDVIALRDGSQRFWWVPEEPFRFTRFESPIPAPTFDDHEEDETPF